MGAIKEIDTKFKELKRSMSRRRPFKVKFSSEELRLLVLCNRHRSRRDKNLYVVFEEEKTK